MTVDLVSENVKKGTAQVVVVHEGQSMTRNLRLVGFATIESLRTSPVRVRIYEDKEKIRFVRLGNHFSIDSL